MTAKEYRQCNGLCMKFLRDNMDNIEIIVTLILLLKNKILFDIVFVNLLKEILNILVKRDVKNAKYIYEKNVKYIYVIIFFYSISLDIQNIFFLVFLL